MRISTTAAVDWASHRLLPSFDAPRSLDVYDVQGASFDVRLSVATMTGLINRQQPGIYLQSGMDDILLRESLLADIPTRMHATQAEHVLDELLVEHRSRVKGLVIYDPHLIDSVNVATTLAGIRDAVVVSPQQADQLRQSHGLEVLSDLRTYAWKSRLQAYRWAVRNLLRETSTRLVAGMQPTIAGGLRSYLVATGAFVYWLDPHLALPDPCNGWTTERRLMKRILRSFAPGTPHLGWFVDEPRGVGLASKAALPVLPSDHFNNMEVWTAARGAAQEPQGGIAGTGDIAGVSPSRPSNDDALPPKIYVSFTMSDGDNLQFNQHRMYHLWQDPARSEVPIGWTISPALQEAAPALAEYYERTATGQDELIAGPSGAGYILPSKWPDKLLPAYLQLSGTLMQRMGLTTVEVLDELATRFIPYRSWQAVYARSLAPFGVRGIMSGNAYARSGWRVVDGVPLILNLGLAGSAKAALDLIKRNTPAQLERSHYLNVYIHAWEMTPSDVRSVVQSLDSRYEVVTPGRLLAMIARS